MGTTRRVRIGTWVGVGLLGPVGAVAALWATGMDPGEVRSSTGAWIAAFTQRVIEVGDFAAWSNVSQVPSTTSNLLYPFLVVQGARLSGASPAAVGQVLSAAFLGLCAVLLAGCWVRGRSGWAGVLAAGAVLWPPALATATLIRPDTLAFALALACMLLAVEIGQGRGLLHWVLGGLALGLAYHAREYMVAPAAGALAVGAALGVARRGPVPRGQVAILGGVSLLQGALLTAALPLALGFWPWNGFTSILKYGTEDLPARFTLAQLHYLPALAPAWGLGLLGLGVAAWRGRGVARVVPAVALGALAPFLVFLNSNQQSPQYYLFAHLLLLAGLAGWLDLVPWRGARGALAVLGLALGAGWSAERTPELVHGTRDDPTLRLHSEAWPAPAEDVAAVVDWAMTWAWGAPLVAVSQYIENLDALFTVRHHRPVVALYGPDWDRELPDVVRFHEGRDVFVLLVSSPRHEVPRLAAVEALGEIRTRHLVATMARWPGSPPPPQTRPRDYPCIDWRGACQQLDWLGGGLAGLRRRALDPGAAFAGGRAPGILPPRRAGAP